MMPPQLPTWQDCHELWSKKQRRQLKEQAELQQAAINRSHRDEMENAGGLVASSYLYIIIYHRFIF